MRRRVILTLTVTATAVFLTACATDAGAPSATLTPSPTSSAAAAPNSETPAIQPSPTAASTIIIGAETVDVVDTDGSIIVSVDYSENGDAAVAALLAVLGPAETSRIHQINSDRWDWGGFAVDVARDEEGMEHTAAPDDYDHHFTVRADAASTSSRVSITAEGGASVGSDYAAAASGKSANEVDSDSGTRYVLLDLPESFPGLVDHPQGTPNSYGVLGIADKESPDITRIFAPEYLFSEL